MRVSWPRLWSSRMKSRPGRWVASAVAVLVVAGLALVLPQVAGAADTLLSQGKPALASSEEGAGYAASLAVDGDVNTRWGSQFADPQWLRVDLGQPATVSQVVLRWESAYATAYQVQTSLDAVTWTTIYSTTTSTGGVQTIPITVANSGRYVRMYGTARVGGYGYSLWEFQVYGSYGGTTTPTAPPTSPTTPATCGTTNAALNQPATASSTENAQANAASAAFDGNAGTRWSSAFSDPQWLQVDLGSAKTVCQVVLQWESAYGKAYQLQTATDPGGPWTTIYSTTTSAGGNQTITVSTANSGRYVRMYGTARGTGYGYSLWEMQVYTGGTGTTSPPPPPPPPGFTTVWTDDFTGAANTLPSATNWQILTGTQYPGGAAHWGTSSVETDTNSTANVSLDGAGKLNITAVRDGSRQLDLGADRDTADRLRRQPG